VSEELSAEGGGEWVGEEVEDSLYTVMASRSSCVPAVAHVFGVVVSDVEGTLMG
jgi:hypothetical protein